MKVFQLTLNSLIVRNSGMSDMECSNKIYSDNSNSSSSLIEH